MAKLLSDERVQKYRSEAEMGSQSLAELLGHIDALQAHWDSCRESYRAMETGYTGLVHKVQEFKDDAIIDHEAYISELTLAVETQHEAQRRAEQAETQLAEAQEALRFYGERAYYHDGYGGLSQVQADEGMTAREILETQPSAESLRPPPQELS